MKQSKAKTGDRVLVLGGSGGVGTILLQLLKSRGAHVTATSSDTSLLKDLGVRLPEQSLEQRLFVLSDSAQCPNKSRKTWTLKAPHD